MTNIAISGESIGKRYRLGERRNYRALRDVFANAAKAPASLFRTAFSSQTASKRPSHMWALKDASFEVREGEVVGIVGRNGAGKSTLLKILARVTKPTEGFVKVRGRLGSLLEVGTGFHSELTGRENVYLSGAILGMRRKEISAKFDEIVAFSEVEKFIDTPIKHYSSGMQMRLAFAVAAHLEPEVLLVDEVLAVGDATFQKKCLGKMGDAAHSGRTILFVSHQMNQIRRLCERVMWVDGGRVRMSGPTTEVVTAYESSMVSASTSMADRASLARSKAQFLGWEIVEPRGASPNILDSIGPVTVKFRIQVNQPVRGGHHGIVCFNADHQVMWGWAADGLDLKPGVHEFVHTLPMLPLRPGAYSWYVSLWEAGVQLDAWSALPEMFVCTEVHQHPQDRWSGVFNLPSRFLIEPGNEESESSSVSTTALNLGI
jgi:lipopolysaccharide transport system ATP-binding protein